MYWFMDVCLRALDCFGAWYDVMDCGLFLMTHQYQMLCFVSETSQHQMLWLISDDKSRLDVGPSLTQKLAYAIGI